MSDPAPAAPVLPLTLPPRPRRSDGRMRRVGVELEFTGLSLETIAERVSAHFGGRIETLSDYEHRVIDTRLGNFAIALDYHALKQSARESGGDGLWRELTRFSENLLGAVAQHIVPLEVVAPPLPVERLHQLHPLVADLRAAGAAGTHASALYAFGLHLNIEPPDVTPATLLAYIRAFAVAFEWLVRVGEIDPSRRLFPFIRPFPPRYVRRVCAPDYRPDRDRLIDDYLADNPSRNRALDMLPLFAWLDEARVRAVLDDPLIKARPALHYRLPNCEIGRAGWNLQPAWAHWRAVEALAADAYRLERACRAYLGGGADDWPARFPAYIDD